MSANQLATLILLTDQYPFGKGETFLESEIQYLASKFEHVYIISDHDVAEQTRETPPNVQSVILKRSSALSNYLSLLNFDFIREFLRNLFNKPMKNKVAIKSWLNAQNWLSQIQEFPLDKAILYSYWLDDKAIALASLKKKRADVKVLSRAHRWDIYQEEHLYAYLPFRRFLFQNLDKIYSISEDGIKYLETLGANNVELSRLGTKASHFDANTASDTLHLISISYLLPRKRMNLLLDALKSIAKDNLSIRWTHFGDGPMMEELVNGSKEIPEITIDFQGFKKNPEVLKWLKNQAHECVLVNLSESEGIPVSMMEAMSFGVPCIGTDVGGVAEIIEDGYNGLLLPSNPSIQTIAECILKFYQLSVKEKAAMHENAYHTWQEKYKGEKNFSDFVERISRL